MKNRNFEPRFRRKNNNFNDNSIPNNLNNNNRNFNSNNNNNNNPNFNNRNNNNNNNNNPISSRLGNNAGNRPGNNNPVNHQGRFQRKNNGEREPGNWKTRDTRGTRRPMNNRRSNYQNNNPQNNPQNSQNRRYGNNRQNDGQASSERWFKVTVPMGAKIEPFFAVNAIQQQGIEFTPFNYTINGMAVEFYVQGEDLAYSIKGLTRRISTPDGYKLLFLTEKSSTPLIDITPEFVDKLKLVMSKRYDVNSKLLNLSQFSSEQDFLSMRLYVSLQRINVCKQVVEIIIGNIPDLVSLNLSNNKIQNLDVFKPLVTSCKSLKQLDLSHNNVSLHFLSASLDCLVT